MRRPPTTLGILSIVFGALAFLCTIATDVEETRNDARPQRTLALQLGRDARVATNHALSIGRLDYASLANIVHIAMALALITLGIGLCRNRDWARRAGFAWGVAALVVLAGTTLIWFALWNPHYQELCRVSYAQHNLEYKPFRSLLYGFLTVFIGLAAVFPTVMILQLRPPTRAIHRSPNP
ncbi:MAG TPA: hypothetical protein VIA18_16425 [Polyangia bacterium]|jgi:hypothetical protein|nr:hypothetical protein [Polyangia bacterium]